MSAAVRRAGSVPVSYGTRGEPDYHADNIREGVNGGPIFDFRRGDDLFARVSLQIPGLHSVQNATAALAVVDRLGLSVAEAAQALRDFRGAQRRFQIRGTASGITLVDDYAHHPAEIKATLSAAKGQFPGRRIWAVWQPHTYLRTQLFFDDFISALELADKVVITRIFAARETIPDDFSAEDLVEAMSEVEVFYAETFEDSVMHLTANLEPEDLVIVLSAGDANQITAELLKHLEPRDPGRPAVSSKSFRSSPVY